MQDGLPSQTARGAAAYRAVHQTLDGGSIFRDPFALRILDDETRAGLDGIAADESLRPMRLLIAARSRFSEDMLSAAVTRGIRQVVVLGAGLDTFALRNPHAGVGLRVFEVDYPATQAWKRERLKDAGIEIPASLIFAPVDFERQRFSITRNHLKIIGRNGAPVSWRLRPAPQREASPGLACLIPLRWQACCVRRDLRRLKILALVKSLTASMAR